MQQVELRWRAADGVELFGRGWFPEERTRALICLVYGQGGHSGRYAETASALVKAGFGVLSQDLRGHGRSGGPRGHTPSYRAWMDDIALLVAEAGRRAPALPLFLYGHSMGGSLVLGYTMRRPRPSTFAGVIASSPWLRLAAPRPDWLEPPAALLSNVWPSFTVSSGIAPEQLTRDEGKRRALSQDRLAHTRVSLRLYLSATRAGRRLLERAGRFPAPLLLMHGDADAVTSPEASAAFAAAVPGDCTFKRWPGFRHELHNEPEREDVYAFVIDWLNRHANVQAAC